MSKSPSPDSRRAIVAAKTIFDGRDERADQASILVTLEHTISLVLLAVMNRDHHNAARMLNEGVVPGVEMRLAHHAAKGASK